MTASNPFLISFILLYSRFKQDLEKRTRTQCKKGDCRKRIIDNVLEKLDTLIGDSNQKERMMYDLEYYFWDTMTIRKKMEHQRHVNANVTVRQLQLVANVCV